MKCLFLKGNYMIRCTAVPESYIPSIFELDEYCRGPRHRLCPLYRQAETEGKTLIRPEIIRMPTDSP